MQSGIHAATHPSDLRSGMPTPTLLRQFLIRKILTPIGLSEQHSSMVFAKFGRPSPMGQPDSVSA
jgi:hypothetical protein